MYIKSGKITVISGPMRSGKSEELIRNIIKYKIAESKVLILKPKKDTRDKNKVISRNGASLEDDVYQISTVKEAQLIIKKNIKNLKLLAIDEYHLFNDSEDFTWLFMALISLGVDVMVVSLDMDHSGNPIESIGKIMAIADQVIKVTAICCETKNDTANMTIMKEFSTDTRIVGGDDIYEPLCRSSWFEKMKQNKIFKEKINYFESEGEEQFRD